MTSRNVTQQVHARLTLASVTATEGRSSDALQMAKTAVSEAAAAGLDAVAAVGLIDLTATLMDLNRLEDADQQIQRAIRLADDGNAKRTAARAHLQLAELRRMQNRPDDAIAVVDAVLPFLRTGRYRRLELTGLLIEARAQQDRGQLEQARERSSAVLAIAESLKDEAGTALAASLTASVDTQLGRYPQALDLRERAEAIYRRQGNRTALPYALANHADVLIRLGRARDATTPIAEIESGIAAGLEAYSERAKRVASLKAFAAATALQCQDALRFVAEVRLTSEAADSGSLLGRAVGAFCEARLRRPPTLPARVPGEADAVAGADLDYWLAAAALARGDSKGAATLAADGLTRLAAVPNDELRWRLATVALGAAQTSGDEPAAARMAVAAADAMSRLRNGWQGENRIVPLTGGF